MEKEHLDKWIDKCIQYYNQQTNSNMKTPEEEITLLKQAHGRMHNQSIEMQKQIELLQSKLMEEITKLNEKIKSLQPAEQELILPENLQHNKEYKAVVTEIVKTNNVKWKGIDYTNWELRLEGKPEYIYLAFIPTGNPVNTGDVVRFTYAHPFQLKKCKVC